MIGKGGGWMHAAFLDGSDPGMDISVQTRRINAVTPMSQAQAHALCDWALASLHAAYQFSVTSIGTAKAQLTTALDNARYDVEGLSYVIDSAGDPVDLGTQDAIKQATLRAVIAYNAAAQASSDSAAHSRQLEQDLVDNLAAVPGAIAHAAGAIASGAAGGLVSGLFSNVLGVVALGVAGYFAWTQIVAPMLNRRGSS